MAAPAYRAHVTDADDNGVVTFATLPTGTVAGDLLICAIAEQNDDGWTAPSGWSQVRAVQTSGGRQLTIFSRRATGTETLPISFTRVGSGGFTNHTAYLMAVSGTLPSVVVSSGFGYSDGLSDDEVTAPSVTTPAADALIVGLFTHEQAGFTAPSGMISRGAVTPVGSGMRLGLATVTQATAGASGDKTATFGSNGTRRIGSLLGVVNNRPPNAPPLVSPVGAVTVDRTATQRLDWTFSDPDTGDSQSKFDLRYRLTSSGTWTDVSDTTSNSYYDVPSGTFAAGDHEWQVRTYDSLGEVGPWSGSGFFTAATPPTGPSITDPINGQTITDPMYAVVWSFPTQDAYQLRTVADIAGSPDIATVYTDTGTVEDGTARSRSVTFATNNRTEHVQVRVRDDGLWSPWASVRVDISYTPPMVPTLTVLASDAEGAISVTVTNPAPTGGEPQVSYNDIWRREDDGDGFRVATMQPPNGVWLDYTPASGVSYEYAVVAVGTNGSTSQSAWEAGTSTSEPITYYGGGYA